MYVKTRFFVKSCGWELEKRHECFEKLYFSKLFFCQTALCLCGKLVDDGLILLDTLPACQYKQDAISKIIKIAIAISDSLKDLDVIICALNRSIAFRESQTICQRVPVGLEGFKSGLNSLIAPFLLKFRIQPVEKLFSCLHIQKVSGSLVKLIVVF